MTIVLDGTTGITTPGEAISGNLSYTGTLTGGTGVVNLGSGQVYKDASGNVGIGTSSPAAKLHVAASHISGNDNIGNVFIATTDAQAADVGGKLTLGGIYNASGSYAFAGIAGRKENSTSNNVAGYLQLLTTTSGGSLTERARIDSSGNLLVGCTVQPFGSAPGVALIKETTVGRLQAGASTTSARNVAEFYNPNGVVGTILISGSATSYNTSSDYRLKNTIAPMTGALAKVALLKPCTYKWNVDGSDGQGFIAHELAEVSPECVGGEKDAVDADGNPQYQGIDTSFLIATLSAAIQELKAIVDAQATRITALEGAAA